MKKTILVLGLLASLVMLVGCAKSAEDEYDDFDYDSYVASGDFTITEKYGICPDQQWAKNNNYSKDNNGKYYYYMYILTATTKEEYKDYEYIHCRQSNGKIKNIYRKPCKNKILKMLDDGKFSTDENVNKNLNIKTLILNSEPDK